MEVFQGNLTGVWESLGSQVRALHLVFGFGGQGLGFGVWGLGFSFSGLGFRG